MDLKVVITNNGGDLQMVGNSMATVDSFENMVLLGMFGGNVEGSTAQERISGEEAYDYWGNKLIWENEPGLQWNSLTERTLREVPLNSSGRQTIENAVKTDLAFMEAFAEISCSVKIISDDVLEIRVILLKPDNLERSEYIYIWDGLLQAITNGTYTSNTLQPNDEVLQHTLPFTL